MSHDEKKAVVMNLLHVKFAIEAFRDCAAVTGNDVKISGDYLEKLASRVQDALDVISRVGKGTA